MAITISATSAAEDATGELATLSSTGAVSYAIADADAATLALFAIQGDKLVLKPDVSFDFETAHQYTFRIDALDSDGNVLDTFAFTNDAPFAITDVNDSTPTLVTLSSAMVSEAAIPGETVVGTLSVTDADTVGAYTYSFVDANGDEIQSDLFEIIMNGNGEHVVRVKAALDYEMAATHVLKVRVSDGAHTHDQDLTITVGDENDSAPTGVTLKNADGQAVTSISEAAQQGAVVGTLGAVDPDAMGNHAFAIMNGDGDDAQEIENGLFVVVADEENEGVYCLVLNGTLDHEQAAQTTVYVKVMDGAHSVIRAITLNVTDVNDSTPTNIQISGGLVSEKAAVGTEFATLSATDADMGDTFTYALVTDASGNTAAQNAFFEIAGNKIKLKAALNDAQVGLHELWVKATDAAGHSIVKAVTIGAYNTEEAPENLTLTLASPAVGELSANGTIVGDLTAGDQDAGDQVTFTLTNDAGGRFAIEDGKLVVKNGLKLDYEQARSHQVTVQAKDSMGLVTLKTFTVNIGNVVGETVNGSTASETFFGGAGRDVLNGGAGKDILGGGTGNDILTGGTGTDSFVFNTALNKSTNVDTIRDFVVKDDTIRLEHAIFKKLTKTGTLSKDFFVIGPKAKDKNDYVVYDNKTGALYYDADGSGKGAAVKFAVISTKPKVMTHADFAII